MGIIRGGILGGFRNKAGAVIGSYWRTLDIIKGLPRISGKAPTQKQLDQRAKFKLVTSFLSSFSDMIDIGFKALSSIDTPMNVAVSYTLKQAVNGASPNFAINYPEVMFSAGALKLPITAGITSTEAAELVFTWVNIGGDNKKQRLDDKLSIMVYCPLLDEFVTVQNVVDRSAQTYTLSLPASFSGEQVHCYIAFNSVFHKDKASDSKYLGYIAVI